MNKKEKMEMLQLLLEKIPTGDLRNMTIKEHDELFTYRAVKIELDSKNNDGEVWFKSEIIKFCVRMIFGDMDIITSILILDDGEFKEYTPERCKKLLKELNEEECYGIRNFTLEILQERLETKSLIWLGLLYDKELNNIDIFSLYNEKSAEAIYNPPIQYLMGKEIKVLEDYTPQIEKLRGNKEALKAFSDKVDKDLSKHLNKLNKN